MMVTKMMMLVTKMMLHIPPPCSILQSVVRESGAAAVPCARLDSGAAAVPCAGSAASVTLLSAVADRWLDSAPATAVPRGSDPLAEAEELPETTEGPTGTQTSPSSHFICLCPYVSWRRPLKTFFLYGTLYVPFRRAAIVERRPSGQVM